MSLPKRRKPQPMGLREAPQVRCASHLQWVRGHFCTVIGEGCDGSKIEAAHVRSSLDGGVGLKPGDQWTIPLCGWHHREQHQIGESAFERKYKINMRAIAEGLAARSPHKHKWSKAS